MIGESKDFVLHQLGCNQEIGAVERLIQALDGQHVAASLEQVERARHIDVLENDGIGLGARGRCEGIPLGREWGVAARDFSAVEIGDEAVVVLHAQRKGGED